MALVVGVFSIVAAVVALVRPRRWIAILAMAAAGGAWWLGDPTAEAIGDGARTVVFVLGMVLIAAAADRSGLLARLAHLAAARAHRPVTLLLATFGAGVAITTVLNLDTTAVLFTPLAVRIADDAGQPRAPFAVAALAAANFGSMLLPGSNLTNLVIWRETGVSYRSFAATTWPVALFAVVSTVVGLLCWTARSPLPAVTGQVEPPTGDRRLQTITSVVIVLVSVALLAGAPAAVVAAVGAAIVVASSPRVMADRLSDVTAAALIALLVGAAVVTVELSPSLAGMGAWGVAALGAGVSSGATNLVAAGVLGGPAGAAGRWLPLLIGTNLAVGFTPIASLATVLWRDALTARDVEVPWRSWFLLAVPLGVLFIATAPLFA